MIKAEKRSKLKRLQNKMLIARLWKKLGWIRWLLLCLAFIAFLSASLSLGLKSQRFSSWLLHRLNQKLGSQLSLRIEADKFRLNLWRAKIEAYGLKIWPLSIIKEELPSRPWLSIEKFSLNLAVMPLLKRRLHFQEILIISPQINLEDFELAGKEFLKNINKKSLKSLPSEKESLLPEKTESPEMKASRPWSFRFDRLKLEAGSFSLAWAKPQALLALRAISLQTLAAQIVFDQVRGEHQGWLEVGKGEVELAGQPPLLLGPARLNSRFNESLAAIDGFLKGEGFSLEASVDCQLKPQLLWQKSQFKGEIWLVSLPEIWANLFLSGLSSTALSSRHPSRQAGFSQGKIEFSLRTGGEAGALSGDFFIRGDNIRWHFEIPQKTALLTTKDMEKKIEKKLAAKTINNIIREDKQAKVYELILASCSGQGKFTLPLIEGKPAFNQLEADYHFNFGEVQAEKDREMKGSKDEQKIEAGLTQGKISLAKKIIFHPAAQIHQTSLFPKALLFHQALLFPQSLPINKAPSFHQAELFLQRSLFQQVLPLRIKGEIEGRVKSLEISVHRLFLDFGRTRFFASGKIKANQRLEANFNLEIADLNQPLELLQAMELIPDSIMKLIEDEGKRGQELKDELDELKDEKLKGELDSKRINQGIKTARLEPEKVVKVKEAEKKSIKQEELASPGSLSLSGAISGSSSELEGWIKLKGKNLIAPLFPSSELKGRAELKKGNLRLTELTLTAAGADLALSGFLSFTPGFAARAPEADLKLKIKISDFGSITQSSAIKRLMQEKTRQWPALGGTFFIEARLRGKLGRLNSSFRVEGTNLVFGPEDIAFLEAEGRASSERLEISPWLLRKRTNSPPISGRLHFEPRKKALVASVVAPPQTFEDFASLPASLSLSGQISFNLEAVGSQNKYEISYKIYGNNINSQFFSLPASSISGEISFKNRAVQAGSLEVDFGPEGIVLGSIPVIPSQPLALNFKDGLVSLSGLNWQGRNFAFGFEGSLGLGEERGELVVSGRFPLSLIKNFMTGKKAEALSLAGEFELKGKIGGSLKNMKPDIKFILTDGLFSLPSLTLPAEKINLIARLQPEAFEVETLSLNLGQGSLAGRARLPLAYGLKNRPVLKPEEEVFSGHFQTTGQFKDKEKFAFDLDSLIKNFSGPNPTIENLMSQVHLEPSLKKSETEGKNKESFKEKEAANKERKGRVEKEEGKKEKLEKEKAEISLSFERLNPFLFLTSSLASLPATYKEKIAAGVMAAEISGEINLKGEIDENSLAATGLHWLNSFRGQGIIHKLELNLETFRLINKKAIIVNLQPELLTLEETTLESNLFALTMRGQVNRLLAFVFKRQEASLEEPQIDFYLQTVGDLEALASFLEGINLQGKMALNFHLSGPLDSLKPRGSLELRSVGLELADWPFRLSASNGYFFFSGRRLEFQSFRGLVNGAPWEIGGFVELDQNRQVESGQIRIRARDVPLEIEGLLEAIVSLSLGLESQESGWLLSGDINLYKSLLTADIGSTSRLLRRRSHVGRRPTEPSLPQAIENLALNLRLNLEEPMTINNSFLQVQVQGALSLSGNLAQPFLLGRLVNPGPGELLWAERKYNLMKLQFDFTGVFPPNPILEIQARTELVHRYDELEVRLNLSGPVSSLRFTLQSTPPRSQEELAFLLITGKSLEEIRTEGLGVLREQILLSLASPTASYFGVALKRLLGMEEVRLEPLGIAGETDPGARLTLVKQITPAAKITSSIDITNSQRQTWTVDYRLRKSLNLQGFRLDNGSYGAGLRQSFSLGGAKVSKDEASAMIEVRRRITRLEIKGHLAFSEEQIRKRLGELRAGRVFTSLILNRQVQALESFYRQNKYLQARIEPRVEIEGESGVSLVLEIKAGRPVEIDFKGASLSRSLRRRIEAIWTREPNLQRAASRSARLIENYFKGKGYYRAKVSFALSADELSERNLKEETTAGDSNRKEISKEDRVIRDEKKQLQINNGQIKNGQKDYAQKDDGQKGPGQIIDEHSLESKSQVTRNETSADKKSYGLNSNNEQAQKEEKRNQVKNGQDQQSWVKNNQTRVSPFQIQFRIETGPKYVIEKVEIEGAEAKMREELLRTLKSWRTEEARGLWLLVIETKTFVEAIKSFYEEWGFFEVKVIPEIEARDASRSLQVRLKIIEGPQSRIAAIKIEGNKAIDLQELKPLLRSQEGAAFNPAQFLADRNNLLAFYRSRGWREAMVLAEVNRLEEGPNVLLIFKIEEGVPSKVEAIEFSGIKESARPKLAPLFDLKSGEVLNFEKISRGQKALYDTGDFSLVHVMTEAVAREPGAMKVRVELRPEPVLNVRSGLRYNSEEKAEFTVGLDFRHLFGLGRHGLIHYLQNAQERDFRFAFHDRNFLGLKIDSLLSFYLSRKKEASFTTDEFGVGWRHQFSLPGKVLVSTVLRRSRIHTYEKFPVGPFPFDISLSLTELSLQMVRDTRDDPIDSRGGTFFSSSLTYSPEALRSELSYLSWFNQASIYQPLGSRFIFASNLRLGLATAFDQVMVPARRFYAGGGYSLRGFKQDSVGPYDPYLQQPEGGEAVFITNQEIRFPLWFGLDGVVFYDAGNVFPEVKNLSLTSLRHSLGLGLRLRSPVGLLRFDVGFNLKPKPGEPRRTFFFSLGQIF